MQEGFKYYVNNFELDVLTKRILKKITHLPPPLQYPCILTKIMHLETKKTILWFNLEVTEIFRKEKKGGEKLSFYIPKSNIFLQLSICILARDTGNTAEAI